MYHKLGLSGSRPKSSATTQTRTRPYTQKDTSPTSTPSPSYQPSQLTSTPLPRVLLLVGCICFVGGNGDQCRHAPHFYRHGVLVNYLQHTHTHTQQTVPLSVIGLKNPVAKFSLGSEVLILNKNKQQNDRREKKGGKKKITQTYRERNRKQTII